MTRNWKAETVAQWDHDPCGADTETAFGTPEFFARVERERYVDYAPWMKETIGFERFTGQRVLEVGFGLGTDHLQFARAGASCFGIDLTPAHVRATARRLRLEQYPLHLTRGDAETLPFADASFDAVYSFGVLHHTPDTRGAVAEIHRVLRPGGQAIVALYNRNSAFYWGYCVLVAGILRGGFFRDGYRKSISRIERREHSDAVPLVKVYSRRSAAHLFGSFKTVRVDVRHFEFRQAGRPGRAMARFFKSWEPAIARRLGWYLIVHARK